MAKVLRFARSHARKLLVAPAACVAGLEAYRQVHIPETDPAGECHHPGMSCLITAAHVRQLERNGLVVLEGREAVLHGRALTGAAADVASYFRFGWFSRNANGVAVRQDLVCWLQESDDTLVRPLGDGMLHCMRLLRGVAAALDAHGYGGSHHHLVPKQLQLGWYPGDSQSGYVRHLDHNSRSVFDAGLLAWLRASGRRARCLTAILYLNDPARSGEEGGLLRCYPPGQADGEPGGCTSGPDEEEEEERGPPRHTDVVPRGGTLVIFDARAVEHEVLPGRRDRVALTCWIHGEGGKGSQE